MTCPACRTHDLVVIAMQVAGEEVTLSSCSSCDLRWWAGKEGTVGLPSVLDRMATSRR